MCFNRNRRQDSGRNEFLQCQLVCNKHLEKEETWTWQSIQLFVMLHQKRVFGYCKCRFENATIIYQGALSYVNCCCIYTLLFLVCPSILNLFLMAHNTAYTMSMLGLIFLLLCDSLDFIYQHFLCKFQSRWTFLNVIFKQVFYQDGWLMGMDDMWDSSWIKRTLFLDETILQKIFFIMVPFSLSGRVVRQRF